MSNLVPKLYTNCIPLKGASNAVIYDLQRNSYVEIPEDLYNILLERKEETLSDIKAFYKNKYDDIIDEYFHLLVDNEFAFFTDTPELFPKMNMEWDEPFEITNAIVDIDNESDFSIDKILKEISNLHCKFLQFRYFSTVKITNILDILENMNSFRSNTLGIEFHLPYDKNIEKQTQKLFADKRLNTIVFYSAKIENINVLDGGTRYIIHTKEKLDSKKSCGVISDTSFSINIKSFTESQNHNTCLNRKISIDINGDIKNCPAMPQSFGNIKDTTLEEALNHKDFKKYWNITKDDIKVCQDCEFRHVCTDCRAYLEDPEDIYSKPLKCGYDPYTNKWEEWSTNPLKQKAIEYYDMQDLVKKDEL